MPICSNYNKNKKCSRHSILQEDLDRLVLYGIKSRIEGRCKRTDWFIKNVYQRAGYFTPPYETKDSLRTRLKKMYTKVKVASVEGIGCFRCVK